MENKLNAINKISIILLIVIIILLLSYIIGRKNVSNVERNKQNTVENNTSYKEDINNEKIKKVTMEVKEETITRNGATFVITDKNPTPFSYGEWYMIEKRENGKWNIMPSIVEGKIWPAIARLVGEDGKLEYKINWEKLYGELEAGEYRLVKEVANQYIYAEFNIE